MLTLTMRGYQGEADLEAIANLINTCADFDNLPEQCISVAELQSDFNVPSLNPVRNVQMWEDNGGNLICFCNVGITEPSETIDGYLGFQVHPNWRGRDVETQIIKWAEQRMQEVKEQGFPVRLRSNARDSHSYRIGVLESHGFECDRYFLRMERNLCEPIPAPQFPAGFTLHNMNGEADAEAWVDLHNQSFIDHWNYHPLTVKDLKYWLHEPHYKAELDLIAVAADGTFIACCFCEINPDENTRNGKNQGHIGILATRRSYRKIGLGRAMLLTGLHQLKSAGMDTARLGVDADNPNGALQLYESVGFSKIGSFGYFMEKIKNKKN